MCWHFWINLVYAITLSVHVTLCDYGNNELALPLPPPALNGIGQNASAKVKRLLSDIRHDNGPLEFGNSVRICHQLNGVVRRKVLVKAKLVQAIESLTEDKSISVDSRIAQCKILEFFGKHLDSNEQIIYKTIDWLTESLKGNYKDFVYMRLSVERRLNELRDAAFAEEQAYQQLLSAEHELKQRVTAGPVGSILESILSEISNAADDLEKALEANYDNAAGDSQKSSQGKNVEAVVRTSGNNSLVRLVDAYYNHFVLSRGHDSTVTIVDDSLLLEILYLLLLCTTLSLMCSSLRLPAIFGYILAGVVLGPSATNTLSSLVQIETLAEFGIFFIMFCIGLECSPILIMQVLDISALGSIGLTTLFITMGLTTSLIVNKSTFAETAFIGACLSLSSTPLVVKMLSAWRNEKGGCSMEGKQDCEQILLGILVMQDTIMGVLLAFLPALAGRDSALHATALALQVSITLGFVLGVCFVLVKLLTALHKHLLNLPNEALTMGACCSMFVMLLLTKRLGISMELGCFLTGGCISSVKQKLSLTVDKVISPIKDFFSCLFFTSIGLHVFPSFVAVELSLLALVTVLVVLLKFLASLLLMRSFLRPHLQQHRWIIAAGLSQVSEFSFVLTSRARSLGLVSREVYLLVLSVSTMSLLLSPLLWNLAIWHKRSTRYKKQRSVDPLE